MSEKKRFFVKHSKSSAVFVSLGIHVILIVISLSFVAVKVITKDDQGFEAKTVSRPRMQLKKLQVPVNIKKTPAPRLRKRIVVTPKLNTALPDIKMPEITGIKGGVGNAGSVGMGTAGVGFSMPEIEIFGVKGKGEKIFLILDSSSSMMYDEMGGIPAYTIIKDELVRIVDELPSTALFNVAVYDRLSITLFPKMGPADSANTARLKTWLAPLNAVSKGMGSRDYGIRTLGEGGIERKEQPLAGKFEQSGQIPSDTGWPLSSMVAMAEQADTVFLLTGAWGNLFEGGKVDPAELEAWHKSSDKRKYDRNLEEAQRLLDEENRERAARGEPPRVLNGGRALLDAYFPGTPMPPQAQGSYIYTAADFAEAFHELQMRNRDTAVPSKSGLSRRKIASKPDFSFNVIHFIKKGEQHAGRAPGNFTQLAKLCDGEYRTIAGMDAIESYVKAEPAD